MAWHTLTPVGQPLASILLALRSSVGSSASGPKADRYLNGVRGCVTFIQTVSIFKHGKHQAACSKGMAFEGIQNFEI
ncbi:hypothetical protein DQ400_14990 [Vreelandella sulfidaeris]|uniref:Uncharacterized protein n=1 Tax=Vreelandella sulfidaeris TaxID=115553 RepID=A0A365TKP4_9GAMM|nr:hypothetical protein DQ400_14990 [Halomonas sulfidaeris]